MVVSEEAMMDFFNQIGGLPFIISTSLAVVSFIAYTIREINIKKWEKAQEEKHLLLSQKFTRNENLLSKTITSLMNMIHGTNEVRLSGYQKLWIIMLEIKNNFPSFISTAYSIHTKDEFSNLLKTGNPLYQDKASVEAFLRCLDKLSKKAEKFRLMVNVTTWNIYWAYQIFFGRLATLYSMSIEKEVLVHFLDDIFTKTVLGKIIETETLSNLAIPEIFAFQNIFNFFENKFIEQYSDTLSGYSLTKETINNALEINRLVQGISNGKIKKGV
jgi:hypothetical protein